jgi:hypothetical protein
MMQNLMEIPTRGACHHDASPLSMFDARGQSGRNGWRVFGRSDNDCLFCSMQSGCGSGMARFTWP